MAAALPLHVDSTETEVSCLVRGTLSGLVYTGHEGRVRIWRHGTGPEALVIASTIQCDSDDEITDITEIGETRIAISVGRSVLIYDTNKDPPNKPSQRFINCTKEEINHLSVNIGAEFISACDDTGNVIILDIKRRGVFKRCSGHDNICSCALFNPRRQWEIISGGLDCRLIAWDFSNGKATVTMDMTKVEPATPPSSYSVNPPMIHALCFIRDSPVLAAGLGNGKVVLVNLARRNKMDVLSIVSLHSSSVNTIECCAIRRTAPIQEANNDGACKPSDEEFEQQVLLSGGNDGKIVMATLTKRTSHNKPRVTGMEQVKVVEHGSKINFICSDENKFYIADLTNKISTYDLHHLK